MKIVLGILIIATHCLLSDGGKKCDQHPEKKTCDKRDCPYLYKCRQEKCCKLKTPKSCDIKIDTETGEPWKCNGGGSKPCPAGYICHIGPGNLYSICCKEDWCYDNSGGFRRQKDGPWIDVDGCSICQCDTPNKTPKCKTPKRCNAGCQKPGKY